MAKRFAEISDSHAAFMARQHIFFVASATGESRVNVSPRGTEAFRCMSPHEVAYRDLTGSGNETSAHVRAGAHVTIMFCALEGAPMILRLYGHATVHRPDSATFPLLLARHFDGEVPIGTRQIVTLAVELVQTSCGFGVPIFDYRGERDTLTRWAQNKGEGGLRAYRSEKNRTSIDGLPTGLSDEVLPASGLVSASAKL